MTDTTTDHQIKVCCATFYHSDVVRMLLGDVFHPGGLALTRHLAEAIELGPGDYVLDVACGRGASAVHLAEHFGCHVTGLDYGAENVAAAKAHAADSGVAHLTTFRQGDAEGLPFCDDTFNAVASECSFCTFPDKATAAAEMAHCLTTFRVCWGGWRAWPGPAHRRITWQHCGRLASPISPSRISGMRCWRWWTMCAANCWVWNWPPGWANWAWATARLGSLKSLT